MQKLQEHTTKPLPKDAQKYLDMILDEVLRLEEEGYHNPLISFAQYADQMRAIAHEHVSHYYNELDQARTVIKHLLEREEQESQNIPSDAAYKHCEQALVTLKNDLDDPQKALQIDFDHASLQILAKISRSFMDRLLQRAKDFMKEKRFAQAASFFFFLRYLNPMVFEYWLYEAICFHEMKNLEHAMTSYGMSLLLQPKNPFVFFQMANICYELSKFEDSMKLLDVAIDYAASNPNYPDLYKKALEAKERLSAIQTTVISSRSIKHTTRQRNSSI
jgi:tetratricopeptide (TPR) repeat protein